jgi:hypothetical protein
MGSRGQSLLRENRERIRRRHEFRNPQTGHKVDKQGIKGLINGSGEPVMNPPNPSRKGNKGAGQHRRK